MITFSLVKPMLPVFCARHSSAASGKREYVKSLLSLSPTHCFLIDRTLFLYNHSQSCQINAACLSCSLFQCRFQMWVHWFPLFVSPSGTLGFDSLLSLCKGFDSLSAFLSGSLTPCHCCSLKGPGWRQYSFFSNRSDAKFLGFLLISCQTNPACRSCLNMSSFKVLGWRQCSLSFNRLEAVSVPSLSAWQPVVLWLLVRHLFHCAESNPPMLHPFSWLAVVLEPTIAWKLCSAQC